MPYKGTDTQTALAVAPIPPTQMIEDTTPALFSDGGTSPLLPTALESPKENELMKETQQPASSVVAPTDKEAFLSIIEQQPDQARWWAALRVMAGIFAESHDTDEACRAASDYLTDTAPKSAPDADTLTVPGAKPYPRVVGPIESITPYKHRSVVRYLNAPYVSCAVICIVREGREEEDTAALDAACAHAGLIGAAYGIGPKGGLLRVVDESGDHNAA